MSILYHIQPKHFSINFHVKDIIQHSYTLSSDQQRSNVQFLLIPCTII